MLLSSVGEDVDESVRSDSPWCVLLENYDRLVCTSRTSLIDRSQMFFEAAMPVVRVRDLMGQSLIADKSHRKS
jgi:hypothetical protein